MESSLTIRPYRISDLDDVLETLKAALGESPILKRTPALWAWKHEHNPFGPSLVLVAEMGGRLAGVRALMRWDLALPDGTLLRCLRAVDTATHPDFERRGIFRKLTNDAVEVARQKNYDLIFNTPNDRSGAGYLTMGWRRVGTIGVMLRPLMSRGAKVDPDSPPDPADFFEPVPAPFAAGEVPQRSSSGLRTPRSREYLAWRFNGHPSVKYRATSDEKATVVARANIRQGRKEVVLSDILGRANRRSVAALARKARATYVAGWFSPRSPERRAAILAGMVPVPGVRSLTLVARPLRELPMDVFDLANWDLAMSDLELL